MHHAFAKCEVEILHEPFEDSKMCPYRLSICGGLVLTFAALGCVDQPTGLQSSAAQDAPSKKNEPKALPEAKRVQVGKNIVLEVQGDIRRVRVQTEVCLRQGMLEQLMTRKRTKEHEAILAADIDARELHLALTLAGAEPGKPVQFRPKLIAPSGTAVKIFLEYKTKAGENMRVPAQTWIRNVKTKKDFASDWVFAGSILIPDPLDNAKKPFYGANDGDVITVVNFEGACLDVPFLSTKDNADLDFEAHTDRIPPEKTAVTVVLEPVVERKKK
jgi:hypothetical protein